MSTLHARYQGPYPHTCRAWEPLQAEGFNITIYNGELQQGWYLSGRGATFPISSAEVDGASRPANYTPSIDGTLSASVAAWGEFSIVSSNYFSGTGVLDVWIKGSAISSAGLALYDPRTLRYSRYDRGSVGWGG